MTEVSLRTDFSRMERALQIVARDQVPFATARALNDVARSAQDAVNRDMASVFRDPVEFTRHAAVAPRSLAAEKGRPEAVVTLRPLQAKYLLREEVAGTRVPADNTRRPGASALVLPGRGLLLDSHGNIPRGTLRTLSQEAKTTTQRRKRAKAAKAGVAAPTETVVFLAKNAPGNKAGIGGFFRRLPGHKLTRLTAFEAETHYTSPRLRYHAHVADVVTANWVAAFRRRIGEAIATAK